MRALYPCYHRALKASYMKWRWAVELKLYNLGR